MERITSRKNPFVTRLRELASDRAPGDDIVLDGMKLLREALRLGIEPTGVLWANAPELDLGCKAQYVAPLDLVQYASPLKNSPGPVFTLPEPIIAPSERVDSALVLENIQDPGNVGTVLRTAAALGIDAVILCGNCADHLSARAVRASMGAALRQCVIVAELGELAGMLNCWALPLYGAALTPDSSDLRGALPTRAAVAVGNEGHGLSRELLGLCVGKVVIPMTPESESLNAAIAAAIIAWELRKDKL